MRGGRFRRAPIFGGPARVLGRHGRQIRSMRGGPAAGWLEDLLSGQYAVDQGIKNSQ